MTTFSIIELAFIVVVAIGSGLYYSIKAIKGKWLKKITEAIKLACKEAEASGKTGAEKKELVLAQIEKTCTELGVPYKLMKSLVVKLINEIIAGYNAMTK